ncbi:MAG: FecR domain-containing protein [Cyclobacteriaceae bacterium]|nr:FecR domain-containing protein [Cyclobacteriaceae bacterium]
MDIDQNDSINEQIAKSLARETSAEEEAALMSWRQQASANEKHYQDLEKAFDAGDRYYQSQSKAELAIDLDKEWAHLQSRLMEAEEAPVRTLWSGQTLRIAAGILLVAISSFVVYWMNRDQSTVIVASAETRSLTLPDGSTVVLNRNSSLSYTGDFSEGVRSVTLTGEAFFEIVRNEQRPFQIQAQATTVEVLGTSFSVRAYQGEPEVAVTVQTGLVKFSSTESEVKLQAGERGVFTPATRKIAKAPNEDANFLSWKTHKIIFESTSLQAVVETLNRAYGSQIMISATVPATCAVTASFDQQSLEAVLAVLKSTLNLTYRIQGNKIEIIGAGC